MLCVSPVTHLELDLVMRYWCRQILLLPQHLRFTICGTIPVYQAFASLGLKKGSFPVAEMFADKILSLPIFPEITNEQIDSVVDGIKEFYE